MLQFVPVAPLAQVVPVVQHRPLSLPEWMPLYPPEIGWSAAVEVYEMLFEEAISCMRISYTCLRC